MSDESPVARPRCDGVLVVDKACGPTSHDVVAVARRVLSTKAIGHTGTLDPMATGVLVLVVGEATKLVTMLGARDKSYTATVRFGALTDTLDAEGVVVDEQPVPFLDRAGVEAALAHFVGENDQVPPQVSAIKVDGRSMHARVRSGETVEVAPRRVSLFEVELVALRDREADIRLRCGKGFYVRSLARDLAQALGTVGHLSALRRTANAGFAVDAACSFDALRAAARGGSELRQPVRASLIPLATVCQRLPHVTLDAPGIVHLRHGRPAELTHVIARGGPAGEELVAFDEQGVPRALVTERDGVLRVLRGINAD